MLRPRGGFGYLHGALGIQSGSMSIVIARVVVDTLGVYAVIGVVFALVFVLRWVGRLDPLAAHGTIGFRLLVFPGVTALWPLFAWRLLRGADAP